MKVGFRKPTLKKSLKARTTAKWKRQAKKAAYNKVYHKTTFDLSDILKLFK